MTALPSSARRAGTVAQALLIVVAIVAATYLIFSTIEDPLDGVLGEDADDNIGETAFFCLLGCLTLAGARLAARGTLQQVFAFQPLRFDKTALRILGLTLLLMLFERVTIAAGLYGTAVGNGARLAAETTPFGALNSVILAPLFEEMLFRGYLFGAVRSATGAPLAVLVSAAAFALFHFENGPLFVAFVLPTGLLLGYAREATGSIALGLLIHAAMNGVVSALWLARSLGWIG